MSLEATERVRRVAVEDFGGVGIDETVRRLPDEHWQLKAVAAMDRFRTQDSEGWAEYVAEEEWSAVAEIAHTLATRHSRWPRRVCRWVTLPRTSSP
ncbi:hypothetical protein [Frankia sp. Cas3]|uniref:hypothetical protein n=1 Tax=Frankia sp. Cas3 TaxID=3073926 RepID=UPI002AD43A36|nr:hypothetical protein [Frankia sp. Cas3]